MDYSTEESFTSVLIDCGTLVTYGNQGSPECLHFYCTFTQINRQIASHSNTYWHANGSTQASNVIIGQPPLPAEPRNWTYRKTWAETLTFLNQNYILKTVDWGNMRAQVKKSLYVSDEAERAQSRHSTSLDYETHQRLRVIEVCK